jgi:hypothetical protein
MAGAALLTLMSCTSVPTDPRHPAAEGTGDIGSSSDADIKLESYKLPITRDGKKTTRVAYNFWSGEWPGPVIDINSDVKGTTTIQGYTGLRDLDHSEKISCTVKNGVYHPWSDQDPSSLIYYTIMDVVEYKAIAKTEISYYDVKGDNRKIIIPKDGVITNVIPYGENICGAQVKVNKSIRPVSVGCDDFGSNKNLTQTKGDGNWNYEQWLYLSCEETKDGAPLKVFVQDKDLLQQPGIQRGCPADYGKVQGAKKCHQD